MPPTGHPGAVDFWEFEEYNLDPSVAPGLARPVGWRVGFENGLAAWDKFGPLDTDWVPVGVGGGGGIASVGSSNGSITVTNPLGPATSVTTTFGTGIPGPTALGTAGVANTSRRSDQAAPAFRSDLPVSSTWAIDPVNGSDAITNNGFTPATALRSWGQLFLRWWSARISGTITVTVLGDSVEAPIAPLFTVDPVTALRINIIGTLGPTTGFGGAAIDNTLYSGSVTGFVAAGAGPDATDTQLTDAAIPVSYTASGLLAIGVLFKRTNSTALYFWGNVDLGAKTLEITPPMLNTAVALTSALAINDTYSAYHEWRIPDISWGTAPNFTIAYDSVQEVQQTAAGLAFGFDITRNRVWRGGSGGMQFGSTINGYIAPTGTSVSPLWTFRRVPIQIVGGGARGDGTTGLNCFGIVAFSGGFTSSGCQIIANDSAYVSFQGPVAIHRCSVPCLASIGNALINFATLNPAGVGMSGKGNTGKLVSLSVGGRLYYGANQALPPFIAGSTTDATPVTIGAVSYTVAQLPATADTWLAPGTYFPQNPSLPVAVGAGPAFAFGPNAPAGVVTPGAIAGVETRRNAAGQLIYFPFWI